MTNFLLELRGKLSQISQPTSYSACCMRCTHHDTPQVLLVDSKVEKLMIATTYKLLSPINCKRNTDKTDITTTAAVSAVPLVVVLTTHTQKEWETDHVCVCVYRGTGMTKQETVKFAAF